jgi:hypothetical protein
MELLIRGSQVSCIGCSVIQRDNRWFIKLENTVHGPYSSKAIAIGIAAFEVRSLMSDGSEAKISVYNKTGVVEEYCLPGL